MTETSPQDNTALQLMLRIYTGGTNLGKAQEEFRDNPDACAEFSRMHEGAVEELLLEVEEQPKEEILDAFETLGTYRVRALLGGYGNTQFNRHIPTICQAVCEYAGLDPNGEASECTLLGNILHIPYMISIQDVVLQESIDLALLPDSHSIWDRNITLTQLASNDCISDWLHACEQMEQIADDFKAGRITTNEQQARAATLMAVAAYCLPHRNTHFVWRPGENTPFPEIIQSSIDGLVDEGQSAAVERLSRLQGRLEQLGAQSPIFLDPEAHAQKCYGQLDREELAPLWNAEFESPERKRSSHPGYGRKYG